MMDGWDWFGGVLMMLLFWGGLAAVVVFAVRAFGDGSRHRQGRSQTPDAKTVLETRFARGEISQEEFEERISVLERRAS